MSEMESCHSDPSVTDVIHGSCHGDIILISSPEGAGPSDTFNSFDRRVSRAEIIELILTAVLFVSGAITKYGGMSPHIRPIPYQKLDNSGDYVINQVNGETYNGQTVSSK